MISVGAVPRAEIHHQHRSVTGGAARAAVFGVSDGLVSNVSLILGFAGSGADAGIVRLAGLAGAIAGGISMAAGEWISVSAQNELIEREVAIERRELRVNPAAETAELAEMYVADGMTREDAEQAAADVMRRPDRALVVHARAELGVDPGKLASPMQAALASIASFMLGAMLPVLPWLFGATAPRRRSRPCSSGSSLRRAWGRSSAAWPPAPRAIGSAPGAHRAAGVRRDLRDRRARRRQRDGGAQAIARAATSSGEVPSTVRWPILRPGRGVRLAVRGAAERRDRRAPPTSPARRRPTRSPSRLTIATAAPPVTSGGPRASPQIARTCWANWLVDRGVERPVPAVVRPRGELVDEQPRRR